MSFANHNILDIALSLIPPTLVQIRKNLGTTTNKYGQMQANYGEWIEVYGIVQPGSEVNEHVEGVDFSKKHVTIWLRGIALDGTHLQWAPDQIRYENRIYNVVGVKDWYPYDNFRECDCVEALNLDASQRAKMGLPPSKTGRKVTPASPKPESEISPLQSVQETGVPTVAPPTPKEDEASSPVPSPQLQKPSVVGKALIRF